MTPHARLSEEVYLADLVARRGFNPHRAEVPSLAYSDRPHALIDEMSGAAAGGPAPRLSLIIAEGLALAAPPDQLQVTLTERCIEDSTLESARGGPLGGSRALPVTTVVRPWFGWDEGPPPRASARSAGPIDRTDVRGWRFPVPTTVSRPWSRVVSTSECKGLGPKSSFLCNAQ